MALTVPPSSPNNATIPTSLASGHGRLDDDEIRPTGRFRRRAVRRCRHALADGSSRDEGKQAQDSDQGEREGEHLSPQQPILVGLVVVVLVADAGRLIEATGGDVVDWLFDRTHDAFDRLLSPRLHLLRLGTQVRRDALQLLFVCLHPQDFHASRGVQQPPPLVEAPAPECRPRRLEQGRGGLCPARGVALLGLGRCRLRLGAASTLDLDFGHADRALEPLIPLTEAGGARTARDR
jgi:hypothetical protein